MTYRPSKAHAALGPAFYDEVVPARFPLHVERFWNARWAARVGLEGLDRNKHLARLAPLEGSLEKPLALRYHGHQFDMYNPALGDGRGFLHAQLLDDQDRLLDLGTKGSGQTPWSRGGDGRLTLKGGVREVLATEMLEALGVYTSKTFSLFETGEELFRGDEPSPTRSSILVRLSHSHVRIGTFQRLAYENDKASLGRLVEHCLAHYVKAPTEPAAPVALLAHVVEESARLAAQWMVAGFVHGVLNSDNMNVTGESFDYGPWRFLPQYDPAFTAAYFDHGGLYCYARQPQAVMNNLLRLARAIALLEPMASLEPILARFEARFSAHVATAWIRRLGLRPRDPDQDLALVEVCFDFLDRTRLGLDELCFDFFGGPASTARAFDGPRGRIYREAGPLADALDAYEPVPDRLTNPYFQRKDPCTMRIDEVEAAWLPIAEQDDWTRFEAKIAEVRALGEVYAGERGCG